MSVQFRNWRFFARSRKSRNYAEAYKSYVAQAIPQIDAEITEKGHFWMENRTYLKNKIRVQGKALNG